MTVSKRAVLKKIIFFQTHTTMGLSESKKEEDSEIEQDQEGPMVLLHVYNLSPEYNRIAGAVGMVRDITYTSRFTVSIFKPRKPASPSRYLNRANPGRLSFWSRGIRKRIFIQQ